MATDIPTSDAETIKRSQRLKGLGVSRGIGKGSVVFLPSPRKSQFKDHLDDADVERETERFLSAVETAKQQLLQLAKETDKEENHRVAEIFSVHLLILESAFVDNVVRLIREKRVNAELAVNTVSGELAGKQTSVADERFREKYLDIEDVATRLRRAIRGARAPIDLGPNAVVVAREIRPSAVVELAKFNPAGLITEIGGWTSHMSIVAREFRLPMVTGIKNPEKRLTPGDLVVVDGDAGEILLDPDAYSTDNTSVPSYPSVSHAADRSGAVRTIDGVEVIIKVNAEDPDTYRRARDLGVRGVGLYRSELLVSEDGNVPDEDLQAAAYTEMAVATRDDGVSIRTFDMSPEQFAHYPHESQGNPALGLRAIRSSLSEPRMFRDQIRAILRASVAGKVDIVLPMISNLEEIKQAKELIASVRHDLEAEFPAIECPRLGVMIEVPSTVLIASRIAKHVDFLCLGTNDLVQYLLAVDRDNDAVAQWYQTLNPAVLSAIKMVLDASEAAGIPTILCGEMAGSPFYLPVLIGLGGRELSLNVNSIVPAKTLLSGISAEEAKSLVESLAPCETAAEVEDLLTRYYKKHWPHLFHERLFLSGTPLTSKI